MKKSILAVVFLATTLVATSCGDAKKENEAKTPKTEEVKKEVKETKAPEAKKEMAAAVYQCPMDCEKGKTYEKEGKCPTCKMDLAKMDTKDGEKKEASHDGHGHDSHEGHAH
ncbi:heavy metal-binding domain-containing protein [Aureivirga sp. CE67]|uniref:heavy metal-binding domain-containing protein n=1 Tax=Aureivirga sp. CE67 TaxID=1788983 RepID=UPI0018CA9DFC|nr:heavy metal-binding domain-containing protein [Aureivirga sp. CE67]